MPRVAAEGDALAGIDRLHLSGLRVGEDHPPAKHGEHLVRAEHRAELRGVQEAPTRGQPEHHGVDPVVEA